MKLSAAQIEEKTIEMLSKEFEVDASLIVPEAPLMQTLDLDSLDMVDVVAMVERNFGIILKQEDFEGMVSFRDFYNIIERKMNA